MSKGRYPGRDSNQLLPDTNLQLYSYISLPDNNGYLQQTNINTNVICISKDVIGNTRSPTVPLCYGPTDCDVTEKEFESY
jgi:hypothetical protein